MKKNILFLVAIVLIGANYSAAPNESQTKTILTKSIAAVNAASGVKFTMRSQERLVGMKELRDGNIFTKINISPKKIYLNMVTDPNKGTEILYVKGERDEKLLVNPGKFMPTLKLSPFNSLLTKDQHHIVLTSGFGTTVNILNDAIKRADAQKKFDSVFHYEGDLTWNNRPCYKIIIEDPTWTYTTYKAQKGETMCTIAAKLLIPEYSITESTGIKNFDEDLGGKTFKIPTSYAKKTIMYIDKENNFPVFQETYDDKGVFERYQFFNLVVNPKFAADEFTEDFSEYNF